MLTLDDVQVHMCVGPKSSTQVRSSILKPIDNRRRSLPTLYTTLCWICNEMKINGMFHSIIDLFECDEKFITAVEVTVGNSLFHVVVDSDETPTKIIEAINSIGGGRLSSMPLNKINPPHVTYTQIRNVIPLSEKLQFVEEYSKAFSQVLRRIVVCRDLVVAASLPRNEGFDCVTLEGDQVNQRGGMTGGFYDNRQSRLKHMSTIKKNELAMASNKQELENVQSELQDIDRNITELVTELQKTDAERVHYRSQLEKLRQDITDAKRRKSSIFTALDKKGKLLSNVQARIVQSRENISAKREEMGTGLVDQLAAVEMSLKIRDMKKELIACRTERVKAGTKIAELGNNLSTNLVPRKKELEKLPDSVLIESLQAESELKEDELEDIVAAVKELTNGLQRDVDNISNQFKEIKDQKDKYTAMKEKYEKVLSEEDKDSEQRIFRQNMLIARQEEYSNKIRALGPLPTDAFERYKSESLKELQNALYKCNEKLQKFGHVNKQALDQYINFTEQLEEHRKRNVELDANDEKIKELINDLDGQCETRSMKKLSGSQKTVVHWPLYSPHNDVILHHFTFLMKLTQPLRLNTEVLLDI